MSKQEKRGKVKKKKKPRETKTRKTRRSGRSCVWMDKPGVEGRSSEEKHFALLLLLLSGCSCFFVSLVSAREARVWEDGEVRGKREGADERRRETRRGRRGATRRERKEVCLLACLHVSGRLHYC